MERADIAASSIAFSFLTLNVHVSLLVGVEARRGRGYACQVRLRALRKGLLTSKLAKSSPKRLKGPA
eukprot:933434-Pelagomonas_calceolata.AAC.22